MPTGSDGLLTVVGDVDTITDTKASGTLTVRLSDVLVVGNKRYAPIDQQVPLNPNDGTFSIKLPPVGDSGVTYRFELVAYAYVNGQREHFEETKDVSLTADLGDASGIVQYNVLAPVATPGVPSTFLTRTVADARYLQATALELALQDYVKTEDLEEVDLSPYATTDAVNTALAGKASNEAVAAKAEQAAISKLLLIQAGTPDAMVTGDIVRDSNGAATGFDVVWPDGATGRFTGTPSGSFPGAIDGYAITHIVAPGGSANTTTYTQAAVTRDANGAVTKRPAITVA